jgi:hypothetical protein
MSFEVVTDYPSQTVYAPLNTTIDADRDYGMASLEASARYGGMVQTHSQLATPARAPEVSPGMDGLSAAEGSNWWMWGLLGLSVFVWWTVLRPQPEDDEWQAEWWDSRRA